MSESKFPPRRFIINFVRGDAEFYYDDTPPAEEYLSLIEHEAIVRNRLWASTKAEADAKEALAELRKENERLKNEVPDWVNALISERDELRGVLERIKAKAGFCIMGPTQEDRDEIICAVNGDVDEIAHRSFELGSARAYHECASEAAEALRTPGAGGEMSETFPPRVTLDSWSEHEHLLREARAEAFQEAADIMGKGPDWFDRYRELLAKVNEANAQRSREGR